jgi:hypothetical protein
VNSMSLSLYLASVVVHSDRCSIFKLRSGAPGKGFSGQSNIDCMRTCSMRMFRWQTKKGSGANSISSTGGAKIGTRSNQGKKGCGSTFKCVRGRQIVVCEFSACLM